jgi:hypothetical protein
MVSSLVFFMVGLAVAAYSTQAWRAFSDSPAQSICVGLTAGISAGMVASTLLSVLFGA